MRRPSFKRSSRSSSYKHGHHKDDRRIASLDSHPRDDEEETHTEEHHPILSHHWRHDSAAASAPELASPASPTSPSAGDVIVKIEAPPSTSTDFGAKIRSESIRRTSSDTNPVGSPWREDRRNPSLSPEFSFRRPQDEVGDKMHKEPQTQTEPQNPSKAALPIEDSASSKLIGRFLEHQRTTTKANLSAEMELEMEDLQQQETQRRQLPPLPPETLSRPGWNRNQSDILSPSTSVLSDYRNAMGTVRNGSNVNCNFDANLRENRVSFQESLISEPVGHGSIYSNVDQGSSSSSMSREDDDIDSRINAAGVHSRRTMNCNSCSGAVPNHSGEMLRSGSDNDSVRRASISLGSKTKSRLIDRPPTPLDQRSGNLQKSGMINTRFDCHEEEDDPSFDDDVPEEFKQAQIGTLVFLEWVSLVALTGALICSLIIPALRARTLLKMSLWKWEVSILVLICGRLVSGWVVRIIVFFIERNFLLRKRVLYFVYGLKKAVQNVIWLGLVLLTWHLLFDKKLEREANSEPLRIVTRLLVIGEVCAVVWLFKTLLIKVCASNFHVNAFFDRIQESLFNQFVIETLSGPPLFSFQQAQVDDERTIAEVQMLQNAGISVPPDLKASMFSRSKSTKSVLPNQSEKTPVGGSGSTPYKSAIGHSAGLSGSNSKKIDEGITIDHLHKLNQKNVSAWGMKRLMRIVRYGALTTLDEQITDVNTQEDESATQIKSEVEAKAAARKIFRNVARPRSRYIYLDDLLRFMREEEALKTMSLFEGAAETDKISKSALKNWVVSKFYKSFLIILVSLNSNASICIYMF